MNIVLFGKDLRITDHKPLADACKYGEVIPLYIAEPSFWLQREYTARHFQFVYESLEDMSEKIEKLGGKLFTAIGDIEKVFDELIEKYAFLRVFFYNDFGEAGPNLEKWVRKKQLQLMEYNSLPLVKKKTSKGQFQKIWDRFETESPIEQPPAKIQVPQDVPGILTVNLKKLKDFSVKGNPIRYGQTGGETEAVETLESFLQERHEYYIENYNKPLQSSFSSSRLSPYLTWGNISLKAAVKKTNQVLEGNQDENSIKQLKAFKQSLFLNLWVKQNAFSTIKEDTSILDDLRVQNKELAEKWILGETGIPMADACMRCLRKTGWLPYHLRAMLVSFACNSLLLDWKSIIAPFAGLQLDYDPLILHNEIMVNCGVGNIKNLKLYNPVKIGKDFDKEGDFIRRYIPELSSLTNEWVHEPWRYPGFYNLHYQIPVTDIAHKNKQVKQYIKSLLDKEKAPTKNNNKISSSEQLSFDL